MDGSDAAWRELLNLAAQVSSPDAAASHAAYQRLLGNRPDGTRDRSIEPLLDVDNLIDYMILNFYNGNTDWPTRNWYVGRRQGPNSTGFKFFAWDSEWVLNLRSTLTTDRTGVDGGVAMVYGHLRNNPEFRLRFADRVQQHFSPGGALYVDPQQTAWDPAHPETNAPAARYQQLADQIDLALVAESARWGDQHFEPAYTPADWQRELEDLLANYFPRRSAIVWDQIRQAGLYPVVAAPELSQPGGVVPGGFELALTGPGTIYYTLDGSDPRTGIQGDVELGQSSIANGPSLFRTDPLARLDPGQGPVAGRRYLECSAGSHLLRRPADPARFGNHVSPGRPIRSRDGRRILHG